MSPPENLELTIRQTADRQEVAQVILRLKFLPEGKAHNQAVIDALVWDDWLRPQGPADR